MSRGFFHSDKPGLENSGKPWTKDEDLQLVQELADRKPMADIATAHKRSLTSVTTRMEMLVYAMYKEKMPIEEIHQRIPLTTNEFNDIIKNYERKALKKAEAKSNTGTNTSTNTNTNTNINTSSNTLNTTSSNCITVTAVVDDSLRTKIQELSTKLDDLDTKIANVGAQLETIRRMLI